MRKEAYSYNQDPSCFRKNDRPAFLSEQPKKEARRMDENWEPYLIDALPSPSFGCLIDEKR